MPGLIGQQTQQNMLNGQQYALGKQQLQANALGLQQAQQQQARQAALQTDIDVYNANPTPDALYRMAMKWPEQAKNFAQAASLKDEAQQKADLGFFGGVYTSANAGKKDLVLKQLMQRQAAEKAAGVDTSQIDSAIQDVQADSPDALKNLKAYALSQIYAHDPAQFAKVFDLSPDNANHFSTAGDGVIYDQRTGQVVREAQPKADWQYDAKNERWIQKPGTGGGDQVSGAGGASGGSGGPARVYGWTPRARYGGDNSDAAVDSKIAGMSRALGVDADTPFAPGTSNMDIARALTISEGGAGSLADRNNNPGNLRDPKTGAYRKFPTKEAGLAAAAAQVGRNRARGQNSIRTMVEGIPTGGKPPASNGGAGVINVPSGNGGEIDPNLTGDAFLAQLPAGRANLLRAINEGRAPAPKPGSRFGEALSEDLARAFPGTDNTQFAVKQQVRKDFTGNGKAATALASYNRFAAHLNSAWALHLRLPGPNLGPLSGIAASAAQSFSPKDVNAYNTEIDGIQGEFQKLTKLGVANEGEANRLIHAARAAQSAEGRAGALEAMASLVAGAYQPQVAQWRSAFPDKPLPVDVTPQAKAVINNVIHGGKRALPTGPTGAPVGNDRTFRPTGGNGGFRILQVRPK